MEKERAECLARADEVFAEWIAADAKYTEARIAEDDALTAICAHRCGSSEELEIKIRFLQGEHMEPEHFEALLWSLVPDDDTIVT